MRKALPIPSHISSCGFAIASLFFFGCSRPADPPRIVASRGSSFQKIESAHLPNAYRLHDKVISGGQPNGEPAFRELQALGVKTVISVDGAKPAVDLAKRYGLQYVHLPHGYDGIADDRAQELAKAVRDLPGPIYIHCHHGKHRSPAASAVACVSVGFLQPSEALGVLKTAGTSEHYRGLYESASSAKRIDDAILDALKPAFPETAKLPPLAEAMVAIEHTHEHLKELTAAGWQPTAKNPDIDPPHEALLLREHFTELSRSTETAQYGTRYQDLVRQSEEDSRKLEAALRMPAGVDRNSLATNAFDRITKACTACHREFRDVPLTEKQGRR